MSLVRTTPLPPDILAVVVSLPKIGSITRASNDGEAVCLWLSEYDNPNTISAFRKEAERFLLWAASRQQKLADIAREDIRDFKDFLKKPEPRALWCGKRVAKTLPDGTLNPEWKPFLAPLSDHSQQLALTRIKNLFDYLEGIGYLSQNPFAVSRGRRSKAGRREVGVERIINDKMWLAIQRAIQTMPVESELDRVHRLRADWIVSLLYHTGARRSEAASAMMGDLTRKKTSWWWRITGKGQVVADIPLPSKLIAKLVLYREGLGLPSFPTPGESTPLIGSVHPGRASIPMTPRHLHEIVKAIMAKAVILLESDTEPDQETIRALNRASAHWFRHSYATRILASGARLDEARRLLRHASIQTTQIYLHQEDQALVDAVNRLE